MNKIYFCLVFFLFSLAFSQEEPTADSLSPMPVLKIEPTRLVKGYVYVPELFQAGWHTLNQPMFWQKIMRTPSDSLVFNTQTRDVIKVIHKDEWRGKNQQEKDSFKDNLRTDSGLDSTVQIYATWGQSHHFTLERIMRFIPKANQVFVKHGVDPFFCQSILLVESPSDFKARSNVGARGPFQLMRSLARQYGLMMNKQVDQRTDLEKSARVAALFIKQACIPRIKKGLLQHFKAEEIDENALWFRLLVLHAYHAGPANVLAALELVENKEPSMVLIQQLWQTKASRFKNASQNYSQLILAANVMLYERLFSDQLLSSN
jgi:hypothetical protein